MFSLQAGMEPKGWSLGEAGWVQPSPLLLPFQAAASDGWERVQQFISLWKPHCWCGAGYHDSCYLIKNPACVLDRWMSKYSWLKNCMAFLIWVDRRRCGWGWETGDKPVVKVGKSTKGQLHCFPSLGAWSPSALCGWLLPSDGHRTTILSPVGKVWVQSISNLTL